MRFDKTRAHDVVYAVILALLGAVIAYALYRLAHQPYAWALG